MNLNKIYNEDCRDTLKRMPDNCVDCVISDIPYKIIAGGVRIIYQNDECTGVLNKRDWSKTDPKGCLSRGKIVVSDGSNIGNKWLKKNSLDVPSAVKNGKMFEHNDIKFKEWLPDVFRVLKEGTHCYLMVNGRNLKDLQTEAEKVGFIFQNLLVWDKKNKTPNKYYMQQLEFILMLSKRPARNINNMGSGNLLPSQNIIGNKLHPTEKPVNLIKHLIINSSNKNDIILDMFMGCGTTAIACLEENRSFIGSEISEEYFEIAEKRIKNHISQTKLFQ